MEQEDQRNFLIAMVLMIGFIWAYQTFVVDPQVRAQRAASEAAQQEAGTSAEAATPEAPVVTLEASVNDALATSERAAFDAPAVDGSIRLKGARIDDLNLKEHFLSVEREEELRLLRPSNSANGYYTSYYWAEPTATGSSYIAGLNTDWRLVSGDTLAPGAPIQLETERDGLRIEREISVDDQYVFTFEDTVTNTGAEDRRVFPLGSVTRHGEWKDFLEATDPGSAGSTAIVHLGLIGVIDGSLELRKYKGLSEGKGIKDKTVSNEGGWIGFTDKYWMAALLPEQTREFRANFARRSDNEGQILAITTQGAEYVVPTGGSITSTNRVFAGAKELAVLKSYEETLGIPRFDDAVDWGFLYFLTKPFFTILLWLEGHLGNFGLAILGFTILIKIPLIPLYNTSFKSMAKMKKLTEPMKEIRERFAADPKRQQQEIMKLYQKEKANPITGCLPILATIPIFYALYKTLFVTLEMRHEPFLYINDLSSPDPTAIGNLFGLLPWAASDVKSIPILGLIIGIGVLPLLYGVTMAALQSLNPPPPDPMQRRIIMFLPIIFTFVFAGFAAGLVLYWVWNNVLTMLQQYFIMRRNGAETEIGKFIAKRLGQKKEAG